MLQIVISAFISLGMILGAFNYTEQHPKFGASQTISSLTALTSPDYDDVLAIVDSSPTPTTKKMTWAVATSSIKTDFDTIYSSKFTTSAGLASILTDETGSGGGFTRATSSVLESPNIITSASIAAPTFDVAGTDATGDIWYRNSGGLFTRLAFSAGKVLWASSTTGLPEWNNTNILLNPMTSSSTFVATSTFASSALFTGSQGSPYGGVSIGATAAATSSGNLIVSGTASSSYVIVSNSCTNCVSGYATSTNTGTGPNSNGTRVSVTATCPGNTKILSGGGTETNSFKYMWASYPSSDTTWTVTYESADNLAGGTITAYAVCSNAIKYP